MEKSQRTDTEIEKLDLRPTARRAAYALKKAHPSVVFTSGRRGKVEQARAMAANVVRNRNWIEQTYARSKVSHACQKWVNDNPTKTSISDIAAGLLSVLNSFPDWELRYLSYHLSGDAFDVQPVSQDASRIIATIRRLVGLRKFLHREGGLTRWHAEFN